MVSRRASATVSFGVPRGPSNDTREQKEQRERDHDRETYNLQALRTASMPAAVYINDLIQTPRAPGSITMSDRDAINNAIRRGPPGGSSGAHGSGASAAIASAGGSGAFHGAIGGLALRGVAASPLESGPSRGAMGDAAAGGGALIAGSGPSRGSMDRSAIARAKSRRSSLS